MPACGEGVRTFTRSQVVHVDLCILHDRFSQLSAPIEPPAPNLFRRFPNIFAAIRNGCLICSIQRNGRRESQRPSRNVVHRLCTSGFPFRALLRIARTPQALRARQLHRAAVQKRHRLREESVKVNRTILMPFRHKDVRQTVAADTVVRPTVQNLRQCLHVVPVDFRRVKRQRHEIPERRRQTDIAHLRRCTPHAALTICGGIRRRMRPLRGLLRPMRRRRRITSPECTITRFQPALGPKNRFAARHDLIELRRARIPLHAAE